MMTSTPRPGPGTTHNIMLLTLHCLDCLQDVYLVFGMWHTLKYEDVLKYEPQSVMIDDFKTDIITGYDQ